MKLHGLALLSQYLQDAPQLPQSSFLALYFLRSYKGFTAVTRDMPPVSSRRASLLADTSQPRSPPQKELYLSVKKSYIQSCLLQDHCFCGCTSERSRHYAGCLELGAFQLVFVGFKDRGTSCRRCIIQQASLGRSVDERRCPRDQPQSATARRIRRLFLAASLLAMLSVSLTNVSCLSIVGASQKLRHISVGNCLIAYLYVLVSPCLCPVGLVLKCISRIFHRSTAASIFYSSYMFRLQRLLISCLYISTTYKIDGISNILALRALLVDPLSAFNASHRVHNKPYDHRLHKSIS